MIKLTRLNRRYSSSSSSTCDDRPHGSLKQHLKNIIMLEKKM